MYVCFRIILSKSYTIIVLSILTKYLLKIVLFTYVIFNYCFNVLFQFNKKKTALSLKNGLKNKCYLYLRTLKRNTYSVSKFLHRK